MLKAKQNNKSVEIFHSRVILIDCMNPFLGLNCLRWKVSTSQRLISAADVNVTIFECDTCCSESDTASCINHSLAPMIIYLFATCHLRRPQNLNEAAETRLLSLVNQWIPLRRLTRRTDTGPTSDKFNLKKEKDK